MCRSIKVLHNFEPPVTEDYAAARQYVRKISGTRAPSRANVEAFERAIREISAASRRLLDSLVTSAPPRDRDVEAARARARGLERAARAQRKRSRRSALFARRRVGPRSGGRRAAATVSRRGRR